MVWTWLWTFMAMGVFCGTLSQAAPPKEVKLGRPGTSHARLHLSSNYALIVCLASCNLLYVDCQICHYKVMCKAYFRISDRAWQPHAYWLLHEQSVHRVQSFPVPSYTGMRSSR